jgi:hypothetical protein
MLRKSLASGHWNARDETVSKKDLKTTLPFEKNAIKFIAGIVAHMRFDLTKEFLHRRKHWKFATTIWIRLQHPVSGITCEHCFSIFETLFLSVRMRAGEYPFEAQL